MDRALWKLLRLRLWARVRFTVRGLRTVRGAVFFVMGLLVLGAYLGPQLFTMTMVRAHADPAILRDVTPLALLAFTLITILSSLGQEGIPFAAAEVDFLFCAPLSRRQLLIYKLSPSVAGAPVMAALFALFLRSFGTSWTASFVGLLLAILFVQWTSTAVSLVCQTATLQAYTRWRKFIAGAAVLLVLMAVVSLVASAGDRGLLELARQLRQSTLGFWLFLPLEPLTRTILAPQVFPDLVGWAAAAAAVDGALLALLLWLDVNYLESSVAVSQKRYELIERRRAGETLGSVGKATWRVPALPRLSGAGPVARRQLIKALRSAPALALLLLLFGLVLLPGLLLPRRPGGPELAIVMSQLVFFTLIGSRLIAFDFRGDLDHLDWLKSLPLAPLAIVTGELFTPVLMATALQVVYLAAVAAFALDYCGVVAAVAGLTLPFNLLLFALENLWFLLFPSRTGATTPGDLQNIGRAAVEMFVKVLFLMACLAAVGGVAALAYWIAGSWLLAWAVAWLGLAGLGACLLPYIAWAFGRFDVSLDTPP